MKVIKGLLDTLKDLLPVASAVAGFGLFAGNLVVSSDSFQKKWLKAKLVQSKISTPSSQINVGIFIFYGITRKSASS
jgi:hypothetical protein